MGRLPTNFRKLAAAAREGWRKRQGYDGTSTRSSFLSLLFLAIKKDAQIISVHTAQLIFRVNTPK